MLKPEMIASSKLDKENWAYREEWRKQRLAKFTSSMIYTLMGEKPFTQGALSYIYERVGEELSGVPAKYEIDTIATRWGLIHEAEATRKFGEYLGVDFLITQCLIVNGRFGSTPDAIWAKKKYDGCWDVETGEIKCYPSYSHFIECALCNTAEELYKVDKKLFFQVIDQMDNCDALKGYAVLFHPEFKVGGFKVIPFRKIELIPYFKLLKERKATAIIKFEEVRDMLQSES